MQGARAWLAALALLVLAGDAAGQSARGERGRGGEAGSLNDGARASRLDALAPPEDPSPAAGLTPDSPQDAPAWTVDLLAPLYFNSNGGESPRRGAPSLEATPVFRIGWSRRATSAPLRVSILGNASTDRFSKAEIAGSELLYLRLRLQYDSGGDDQEIKPFLDIQPTREYLPGFEGRLETRHDFDLGVTTQANLDRALRRLKRSADSSPDTVWTLGINASVQRRIREPFASSSALVVNPSVTWTPRPDWSASLEVEATRRFFDREDGFRRRDWVFVPVLTVEWTPTFEGLPGALGNPAIAAQIFVGRRDSNLADARYVQWGAGPVLRTSWRF